MASGSLPAVRGPGAIRQELTHPKADEGHSTIGSVANWGCAKQPSAQDTYTGFMCRNTQVY